MNRSERTTIAIIRCQELGRRWFDYTKDATKDRIAIEWAQENSADFYATARKLMGVE